LIVKHEPAETLPPAIVVHGLAQAKVALGSGTPVTLLSAPGAALYGGVAWWRALIAQSGAPHDILDCADDAGCALEALRAGQLVLIYAGAASPLLASAAASCGARVLPRRPPALDLGHSGDQRRLASWLAGDPID
jgi:hypothetical protein